MVYGKASPHGPHSEALRKVSHQTLGHRLDQSAAKGKFDVFDRLAAESDRREAYKSNARASRQAKADAASAAKTAHYDQLTAAGHTDEAAVEQAFGVPVAKQRDQAALGQLRASGHSGAGLQEAARKGFTAETKARYKAAEDATNGHMLNNTGRSMGVDPASLMTGSEARARKYASPELKEWFDQHGRPTFAEYLDNVRGHVQGAANARAGRGAFHAAAARVLGVVALAADSMAKASSHEQVGKGGPLWKTPGLQLPAYIQHIANDLQSERGMNESRAIATAVAACKRWAAGGGNVDATTRAAASKAIAEWEAAKAKARSVHASAGRPAAVQLAYGAAPTVKPSPGNRGQVHATTPAPKTPVQHKVGARVRTPDGKVGTVVKATESGAHVMCPGDKRPTFHPHSKLTPATRAVSATAARVSLQLSRAVELGTWNEAAHPRVGAGSATGGEFTAGQGGSSSAPPPAKGAAGGKGGKAGASKTNPAAQALWDRMSTMTPAQQTAYLKGLSPAQLQSLGGAAFAGGQAIAPGMVDARTRVSAELSARGLTLAPAGKAGAKGKAAAGKAKGSAGGAKKSSGGGKKSSGGGKSGGSSKSSGGSSGSKSSASKSAAAKASADKKAAAAKTAAEKKAAAAVAAAARAKAAADAKAARAATAAQKKAASDAQKAAAAQAKAAAAAAKAAAAAAAAAKKKPAGPVPPPPASRKKPAIAAGYQPAGRRLLELATATPAEPEPTVGKQIPTVAHLRRAMQAFEQCPPSQRPGLLADIRGATTSLGAGHLEWVSSFLRAHGTATK